MLGFKEVYWLQQLHKWWANNDLKVVIKYLYIALYPILYEVLNGNINGTWRVACNTNIYSEYSIKFPPQIPFFDSIMLESAD